MFTLQVWSDLQAIQVSLNHHLWSCSLQCYACTSVKVTVLSKTYSILLSVLNLISPSLCVSVRLPPSFPCESRLWKYLECTQFTGPGRQVGVALSPSHLSTGVCKGWWREATHTQRRLCLHTHTHAHTWFHVIKVCLSVLDSVHKLARRPVSVIKS